MQVTIGLTVQGFDVAADLDRLVALRDSLPNTLATVAGDAAQTAILDHVAATRGSLTMSNNRQGTTLDAFPIVRPGTPHAEVEVQAVPRGVWHLVEYGSPPHEIDLKRAYGARTRKRGMPTTFGVYQRVQHPGTLGTGVWGAAMEAADTAIDDAVQDAFDAAVTSEGGA